MQLCLSRKRLHVDILLVCTAPGGTGPGGHHLRSGVFHSNSSAWLSPTWALTQALTVCSAVQFTCWHPDRPHLIKESCSLWWTHSGKLESFQRLQVSSSEGQSPQHKAGEVLGPSMTLLTQARLSCQDQDCPEIGLCKCSAAGSWAQGACLWNHNCGVSV